MKILWSTLLLTASCYSAPYPVVTEITTVIVSPTSANYHIKQGIVEVGPAGDQVLEYPFRVGLGHRHDAFPGGSDVAMFQGSPIDYGNGSLTISQIALKAYERQGSITMISHAGAGNGNECVGYYASTTDARPWSSVIFPPGTCVSAPPGNEWCKLITPTIEIDHGVINVGVGNHTAESNVSVQCSAPMKVKLTFGKDVINFAQGLSSKLSIPSANNSWVQYQSGVNYTDIRSDLSSTQSVKAGVYSESTVLFIDYY